MTRSTNFDQQPSVEVWPGQRDPNNSHDRRFSIDFVLIRSHVFLVVDAKSHLIRFPLYFCEAWVYDSHAPTLIGSCVCEALTPIFVCRSQGESLKLTCIKLTPLNLRNLAFTVSDNQIFNTQCLCKEHKVSSIKKYYFSYNFCIIH